MTIVYTITRFRVWRFGEKKLRRGLSRHWLKPVALPRRRPWKVAR